MTLRDRMRIWLGMDDGFRALSVQIDALPSIAEVATKNDLAAVMSHVRAIEAKLTQAHVNRAEITPSQLDWDTVQAMAAYQLQNSQPPKEWEV